MSNNYTERLEQAVERVREHEEWRVEYMTLAMKYSEKKEEGRAEEHDKILENLTKNLMKRNPKLTLEEAKKEAEDLIKVM